MHGKTIEIECRAIIAWGIRIKYLECNKERSGN